MSDKTELADSTTNDKERISQIALTHIDGIGDSLVRHLLSHFEDAAAVFAAPLRRLMEVPGISRKRAEAIRKFNRWSDAEAVWRWVCRHGVAVHFLTDTDYPRRLRTVSDAPVLLYSRGKMNLNAERMLAVVGTRRCTQEGKLFTETLVRELKPYGTVIVSGLAYGIDIIAHQSALQQGLPTIGVLAHGFNRIYPTQHAPVARRMLDAGGLVTEFSHTDRFDAKNFPLRNRIIAALCDATVVVEAPLEGGALITASLAAGYDRDVFCVPGRPTDKHSRGCNALIRSQLAQLIESADDLAEAMGWKQQQPAAVQQSLFAGLSGDEQKILQALDGRQPVHVDQLAGHTQLPASALAMALLNLELQGLVVALPGKMYRRR